MKRTRRSIGHAARLLGLSIFLLLFAACSSVAPAPSAVDSGDSAELAPVSLGVGFVPSVQFTPFYVGIEKGFFEDAGIDLTMDYGYENDYLKLVGTNDSQFMVGSGDQVVLGRAQGLPVRYVMRWYTKYPVVIASISGSGITTPADLEGKSIGIPGPFGASYVAFRGILEAAGLTESDVKMESIGFTQPAALSEGAVDAAVVYAANTPVVLAAEGIDTDIITMDEYLQIPANGLVTNEETINNSPELVRDMLAATLKSIQYTLDNPDEAFQIALKYVPEAGGDNESINRAVFDASLDYWESPDDVLTGETTLAEWQAVGEFMQRVDLTDVDVDPETMYTNDFLP